MASAAKVPLVVFLGEEGDLARFASLLAEVCFILVSFSIAVVFVMILRWENLLTRLALEAFFANGGWTDGDAGDHDGGLSSGSSLITAPLCDQCDGDSPAHAAQHDDIDDRIPELR